MDSYRLKERFVESMSTSEANGAASNFARRSAPGIPIALPRELVETQAK